MPVHLPDVSNVAPIDALPNVKDMFASYLMGAKMQHEPGSLQRKKQNELGVNRQNELSNALKELELQQEKEYGMPMAKAKLEREQAHKTLYEAQAKNGGVRGGDWFRSLGQNAREGLLSQTRGWNMDDSYTMKRFREGATLDDLREEAEANGIDTQNSTPVYSLTTPNITKMQNRNALTAGSEIMNTFVASSRKPYAQTVMGYSPKLISDMASGKNKPQVAKYFAGRILEDENAVQSIGRLGGSQNKYAIHNIVEKSFGNQKVLTSQMTPEVYEMAQKEANEILTKAAEAERKALTNQKNVKMKEKELGSALEKNIHSQLKAKGYSMKDVEDTAAKYNTTIEAVLEKMGIKNE